MNSATQRYPMLDGWRAVSILCVLAGHLLPLFGLNEGVAATGMAIFFTLSGFLITSSLLHDPSVPAFLIRRLFRIVPLAWVALVVALIMARATTYQIVSNYLFFANIPPFGLVYSAGHFWSLSVEVQFYVGIAALVAVGGRRGIYAVPAICFAVTAFRIISHHPLTIVTWWRVDEILAGAILTLIYDGRLGARLPALLARLNVTILAALLFLSGLHTGPLMYARPYFAAMMVGTTLYRAPPGMARVFNSRAMLYIAATSYALYVVHGILQATWLGSGGHLVKYAKRPLLFAATFALAHLSTYRLERPCIDFGKRLVRDRQIRTEG